MQTSPRGRIGHEHHPECAGSRICTREIDLLCPEAVETQKTFIDEREAIHKKTFRKWLNAKLEKATSPVIVNDLIEDLRDGHVLLTLLETLLSTKLPREKGKMRLHKLTNLATALKVLEQNGVKIVGISNYDIADGKVRAILGLVWSIILRFQVQELFQGKKSDVKVKDFHVEKKLLSWCQDVLDGYEDAIKLKDFTVGWRNGLAFNAIIHSHKPELFEFDDLLENDNKTNLQHAFDVAEKEFNVAQLLDPVDIDVPEPDKKLIMMYLTSMYDGLQNYTPTRDRKNKKIQLKVEVDAYKASYSEIILYITQVETIVMSKIDNENNLGNPLEEHKTARDLTKDTSSHVNDVNDVTLKGQRLIEEGKISKIEQQEIKTQIEALEIRWEKLVMLVSRYSKRCQTALVSQKEHDIQYYLVWVRESKYHISRKGDSGNPQDMKNDLKELENLVSEIESKVPEVDREVNQAKQLCEDETIDGDVKRSLENDTLKLERQWHQLKEEALAKQIQIQRSLGSLPSKEAVTVAQDMDKVESAPPTTMEAAPEEPMAYQVQVRRLNINVKSPAVSLRNEAEQKKKLLTWKRKHDETRGAINECELLVKKMKREHDVQLFYDQYEECNQKMRNVDPMVIDTVDHGQNILKDEEMEEESKAEVGRELENLVEDYDDLLRVLDEKKSEIDEYAKEEDSRKRKRLDNWKVTRDELKPKISNCFIVLRHLKAKDVSLGRVELKLHAEKIEACHQQVTSLEPEVEEVIDTGNILLQSYPLDEEERRLVTSDIHDIESQYRTIKDDSTELKIWVDSAIREEDDKKEEQLRDWRSKRDDLKDKISKQHIVLKDLKKEKMPLEPVQLTFRAKKTEEVTSLDPEVERFVDQTNQLLKVGELDEEEKNMVTKDMMDVDEKYEDLRKESTEMKNEVEECLENQAKKKHDLSKWREWKGEISSRQDNVQNTLDKIKSSSTSKNLQTVQDNLLLSEECDRQIKKLEPDIHSALDFGHHLRSECPLSEDERQEIEEDMDDIKKRYDKMKRDASDQHEWLTVFLQEHETAKKDELEKWRETKQNTNDLIDSCRSKLDTANTDPAVSRDIDKQKAITQECQEELPSVFEDVQSSLTHANSLLADDLLSKDEKDEVQADAEEIRNKLRSLQSDIDKQNTRLDEALKQKQAREEEEAMRAEKLAKWAGIKRKLQSFLDEFEDKFKALKSANEPRNVHEIEERIDRTASLSEEILAVVPEIQSGYGYGNELLNDNELDEPDKDRLENEMEVMGDGFKELKKDVNDEHQRLAGLLEEKRKAEGGKYKMWIEQKEKLIGFLDNTKQLVKALKSKGRPETAAGIDEQLGECEEVYQEMSQFLPHVKEGLSFGNHLLEDDDLSDEHKDIIEEDIENMQLAFGGVRKEFEDYQERLKSSRAEVEEVTPMEQQVSESAIDFGLKDQEDMTETQVSSTTVHIKHETGEHLFVIRQNVTADQYLKLLHDDLTPDEKFEFEKQEKLRHWRDLKERIDELLTRLLDKLNRIKAADSISLTELIEQQENAKDDYALGQAWQNQKECKEEIEDSEPIISESFRLGNDLLDDDDVSEAEKERIRGYIATLEMKLRNIHQQADQEEGRIGELLDQTRPRKLAKEDHAVEEEPIGQQFQEREVDWDGLSKLDDKHVDLPHSPLRLNSMEQTVNLKFFEKGPDEYTMNLEDERTPEERRQAYKEIKLDRWRECQEKLDDFLKKIKERLGAVSEKPRDRDDIKKKLKEAKKCQEDIEEHENEVVRCLDVANDILHDDNIEEQDKDAIKAYISELEIQLKVLHREATHDQRRLEDMLNEIPGDFVDEEVIDAHYRERPGLDIEFPDEDTEKEDAIIHAMFERSELPEDIFSTLHEDMTPEERKIAEEEKKLERWRIWQHKLDNLVDRLSRRLDRVKSGEKPKDRKALHERKDEAQDCKEEIEESEPMIRDALDHANDLLDDELLHENEKDKIREYISEMRIKLKELHKDAYDEEERLHELLIESHPSKFEIKEDLVEEEPVEQQFHEREGVDFRFEDDYDVHEHIHPHHHKKATLDIKFKDDDEHGVESAHEEEKRDEPKHEIFTLLFDDLSPNERKEAEKEEKVTRWRDWKEKLDDLVSRLKSKLDRAKTSDSPKDRKAIEDQREDVQECIEEVEHSEPQIRQALDCANDLLDDDELNEGEKEQIRTYISSLEIKLRAIHKQAGEEQDRLDEILDQTPHPKKDVRVEHLAEEEPVDQQFCERPDWEMNLTDEHETEGDADKIVHQMFVAKEPSHYYVFRLHEDMTPEERRQAEQEEKLDDWRKWQEKLDSFVDRVKRKLDEISEQETPQDRNAIRELRDDATECKEEIEDSRPRITRAVDCANELLEDEEVDDSEKEKIRQYVGDLEVELRNVYSRACEEEERLKDSLEGTPHAKPTRYSKPLAQEETIDAHHRERPGIDFTFDDETSEEHPREFVHSMFVVRQPIHHYIWTMEDDLQDGERRDAKKEEKVGRWRDWQDKLDDMLRHLQRKLQRVQSTPKNRNDIEEQRDEAKEIKEDIEESEPYVRKSLDSANELLQDEELDEEEKEKIRKYITELEIQLRSLYKKADEEDEHLGDLLDRTPRSQQKTEENMVDEEHITEQSAAKEDWDLIFHEHDDQKERMPDKDTAERTKMQRWFEYRNKLQELQVNGKQDLNDIKAEKTPTTRQEINEQLERTEGFMDRLAEVIPMIQESFEYGNKLLDDPDLTEPDKDIVEKDIEDIGADLKNAKQDVGQHYQWLKELKEKESTTEDLISLEPVEVTHAEPVEDEADRLRREAENEKKLSRWRSWREKLEELVDSLKNRLDRAKTRDTISSRKALKEQIHDVKARKEELDKSNPEIQEALVYAEELENDEELSEKERMEIKRQITEFNIRLKNIRKQANDENTRLDLELDQMDAEKSDKFAKWRKWREKVRALLDELQGKLYKVKNSGNPKNRKDMEKNIAILKECEESLQSSAPEMQFALDYGRQLADDDILSDNEQKTVKQETDKLDKELNELKVGIEEQKSRMFHAVEHSDLQRISKIEKWNEKKRTSRLLLDRIRGKVGVLKFKLKPRNKNEIDARMDQLQDCEEEMEAVEVEVASCINNGHALLSENNLDKDSADSIRDDVDGLQEDLSKLRDDIDDQIEMLNKLSEKEDEIKKEKVAKYRDWRKEIQELIGKLKEKLKRLKNDEKKEPKTKEEKKDCTDLAKECSRDLGKLQEEVDDLKDYGKGMIDDGSLDDQERQVLEQDLEYVDEEISDVMKDADIIQITLESMYEPQPSSENDHPVMEEWRERVRKVNLGLEVAEDRLDQPSELKNRNEIKDRLEDIKELNIGFADSEPQFLETVDFGKELLAKEDVPDENKLEIKEDLVLMAKRWGAFKTKGEDEEDRLHELLLTTSESDELVILHERCDDMQAWIDDTLSLLETRPVSLSASFGNMKRQQSVTEDVLEDLVQKQVEVNAIIDEGNHLLDDPSCGADERKDIHEKMLKLHEDWNRLSVSLTGRQESIQDALVQLEQQHKDMETTWKKKYGPLRKWISQAQSRLNSKEFAIAPDLDSVKKQRKDIAKFQTEKTTHTSEVNDALQTAEYVLKGPQVDEDEKTVIQEEMQELHHGWEELDESLTWKQNRIEDTIRKLENQKEDKLRKWQEGLQQVNTWITMTIANIKPEPRLANDVDSAYDQIDRLQDFVRDAPIYQDKVTNLNEFSSNLVADPCLGEDERKRVREQMLDCNERWNEFVNLANARQSRLEHNLEELEKDQDDDFNRWTIRSGRASELLDKFESKMPAVDEPLATQLEDVEKQEREFDVFANQVELNETQMDETFSLGEGIANDSKYSKSKREGVQGQLNLLTSRWDRIKDFVDLRKGRLAETAKRLRESRRKKMEDWEYRSGEFDIFLTNCERDIRSPDTINGDLNSVKKQMEDFKIAMSKVRSQKRKVFEYGQYTDEVIADPIMDNVSRDHIKIEKEARIDRWGHIEDMMNNHQARLREKLQELQKGQAEMDGWNTRLVNIQTKIANIEELNSEPVGKDPDVIEKQKRQMKNVNIEKDSLDSQVSDFLTFSEDLMDKPGISTEDRRHIDKQCDVLELRWHKAKGELERRDKSLEEKQEALNRRQKSLLSEWQARKTEVSVWITDMDQRIKVQDTATPDVDEARKQYQELKDIRREVTLYEKEVRKLEDLAETLIEDPGIHSNEKGLVTSEKLSIREHWEMLNTKAHNVQRKVDGRVQDLENEQNRKLQEWRQISAPLDDWINDAETKVESYDPIAYDIQNVQQQNKENELMLRSLHEKQPKFDEVIDVGNVLLKESYVGREDRKKIQEDMEALQERWENVDDVVAKRHDDIQIRLKELEEEENDRKKKEELERKRREEEKKQREERRRQVEEERERQEEEKRRKEYEERKKQEELDKQRIEEERRRREEEEERKRREEEEKRKEEKRKRKEEEANKYIQMTYEPRISKPLEEIMVQSEPTLESSPHQWDDPFAEAESESRERLGVWRDDADSVRQWIKQQERKLHDESDDEDLVGLKEQRKELTKLENELVEYQPTYDDVNRRYKLLAEDQFLNDEDKQALNEDMEDVKSQWENMANVKDQKLKRLEDTIGQKEKRKLDDLIDCRADIKNLNDWITNKNNQFDRLSPLADDLPTLLRQRDELKDFSKDIADHDPKFTECIQSAHKLSKDHALSGDESDVIQKDAEKCEERWDDLNEKVRQRVESILGQLPTLQRKQKDLLADWDDKLDRFKKSIKKSNNNLDEQRAKWPLNEDHLVSSVDLTDELIERVDQNKTIEWRPTVDTSNERLAKLRVKLQRIQRDKKNRKWSFIEAIKEVFGFGRKPKKTGINIDNLITQFEEHEDLMQEVSSLQRSANEVINSGNTVVNNSDVEEQNIMKVDGEMRAVNAQWNTLNFKVIERENRLELLAKEIEDEYQEFDVWRENCETMNQFLNECERLQKDEEKIGTDVGTLQAQIRDCQEFKKEVDEYTPQAGKVFERSQNLIDSGRLDKTDIDGVEKTKDVLQNRWKGINDHLKTRQDSLDSALLDHLKKDSDSRLWKWRDDSLKLEHTLTDAHRRITSDVDETDFVAINDSAEELQLLESAVGDVFNDHMTQVSTSGKDLVEQKTLEPYEEGEVHNALDTLTRRLTDIEKSAQAKKTKIKDASSKYFHRSLSNMSFNANQMEEKMDTEFSDVGADVGEVQKQLASLQKLEDEMTNQDTKLEEFKIQLQESKKKGLLHDDEEQQILNKISKLEITMDRLNTAHDENKKRLTQTLIVLHEELMEEIHDWLNDTEKQVDAIQVNQDDIASLREEHVNHCELKEEITSFEPTFNRAISLSKKLLNDQIVDSERVQSYENEMKSLNERMDIINLKTMDNGTKLSNGFAMYLTTRLDDAEVSLTHAESKLTPDDKGYVDLESAKKQLDIRKTSLGEIRGVKKEVDDIVEEANALVDDGYFKKHEQEHFRARIEKIASRNKELGEQANNQYKRQFDTYIILLRQHLGKMDAWLNKAEARQKATGEIQSGYDRIKKQLEEHQKFQDEIREHSMVTLILELDITDPTVNENVQTQVKLLSERWSSLWRWSEERRTVMLKLINNWQKFRDEQLVSLNWLSSKEKVLKEMGATDLSNEEEVAQQLDVLKKMEQQLDEQGIRLQNLHKAGDDLLKDVDEHDQASKDIKDQLNEFDECWNGIAKQVIDRIQALETSQNKLREFRLEIMAVNEWMDETEQIIGGFHIDMDPEDATRLQGKLDIKCDERSKYQTRVDRINRLGKDLQGTVDQPSYEIINDELEPFNKRWTKVSDQLENLSDKGYPTPEKNECCFIRILRRKLGICH